MTLHRRAALIGLGSAALVHPTLKTPSLAQNSADGMDFSDPVDNLDALVRIYGANDATTFFWYATGRIYVTVPGQVAQKLFDAAALQWIRFRRQSDGTFRQESQFVQLHYADDRTLVETMANPLTGDRVNIPIMQSGNAMSEMEFSVYGVRRTGGGNAPEHTSDSPQVYEWKIDGDDVVLTYEAFGTYQAPWMPTLATENSVRFYKTSLAELNDRTRAAVRATRFEVSETPFMPWLEMPGDQPGHMLWRFSASKHASRNEIPTWLLDDAKEHTPAFFERFMDA